MKDVLRHLSARVRGLWRADAILDEIDEEMRFHIEETVEENLAAGMSPDEARRAAERRFGDLTRLKERGYDVRGGRWLEASWRDVRYAARVLTKSPAFTATAVLTLALAIGANTAIFGVVNALMLKPPPVRDPDGLVWLFTGSRLAPYLPTSYRDYLYYRDESDAFESLTASSYTPLNLSRAGESKRVTGAFVAGNYFSTLGVGAALGRTILPEDEAPDAGPVAVIGYDMWRRDFGAEPGVVGSAITLNGRPVTLVGVAEKGFAGTSIGLSYEVWTQAATSEQIGRGGGLLEGRGVGPFEIVGRLAPGASVERASASTSTLAGQLAAAYPETNRELTATLHPVSKGVPQFRDTLLAVSTLMMSAVGMVLLIACANIANLLLARATGRRKEIAVRLALGATRLRVIRQLVVESLLVALAGGVGGILLAVGIVRAIAATVPDIPIRLALDLSLDVRVVAFTWGMALAAGVAFGVVPALQASKPDLVRALKDDTHGGAVGRWFGARNLLVVGQVAVSLLLLVGAGLFARSLYATQTVDPGFDPRNMLAASVDVGLQGYSRERGEAFYRQLVERVEALPGVRSATLTSYVPLTVLYAPAIASPVEIDGREPPPDDDPQFVGVTVVGPRYFETMGLGLLDGRDFGGADVEGAPRTAIVNETMARRFWPGESPIGKRFRMMQEPEPTTVEVVGVVRDSVSFTLSEDPRPYAYVPLAQSYTPWLALEARTEGDPSAMLPAVRREVAALDPTLPLFDVTTLDDAIGLSLFPARLGASLLGLFALLATLLAAVGVYGVVAYLVSRQTRDIGIRMALGASRRHVLWLVLGRSGALVLLGITLGVVAAIALTRFVVGFLYGVSAVDPATFLVTSLALAGVALLASFVPARRAARIEPLSALRHE